MPEQDQVWSDSEGRVIRAELCRQLVEGKVMTEAQKIDQALGIGDLPVIDPGNAMEL